MTDTGMFLLIVISQISVLHQVKGNDSSSVVPEYLFIQTYKCFDYLFQHVSEMVKYKNIDRTTTEPWKPKEMVL